MMTQLKIPDFCFVTGGYDKDSYIEFGIQSKLINVNAGSDTMSMMGGFDNLDLDSNIDS